MLAQFQRGLYHLGHGTLFAALRQKYHEYKRDRRRAWWLSRQGKAEFIVAAIQPGLHLNLYFDDELSRLIYCDDFEWHERQFLNRFLGPGDVYVDVGANIGLFTLIAAHRVGPSGDVYSFEPCERTFQRLQANVQRNHFANVRCYRMALSDRSGETELTVSLDGYAAWNSLARPIAGRTFAAETVPCIAWDDFAREHQLAGRVTMMKVDIEGWESCMLRGGRDTLVRPDAPVLQVEFTEKASRAAGSSCADVYRMLEDLGYAMYVYDGLRKRLICDPPRESYPYLNLIAAKRKEYVMARLGP